MADYEDIAASLNPWLIASKSLLSNQIQPRGTYQGIKQDNPWQIALANMAQGLVGGAVGHIGKQQYAEDQANARQAALQRELEMMRQKGIIERENKVAEAQALNPLEIEKFKAQEAYKTQNEVEKQKLLSPIEQEKDSARIAMEALAAIRTHSVNAATDAQYAGANAGAAESARLAAQAKYGALPNQGGGKLSDIQQEALKGASLMRIADNLEQAVTKLESSGIPIEGLGGMISKQAQTYFPGDSPKHKEYQQGIGTLNQAFPNLFSQYRVPGTGAMTDYETENYEKMMPKVGQTVEEMKQKIALIRQDALAKMNGGAVPQQHPAEPNPIYSVRMPQQHPAEQSQTAPNLENLSMQELGSLLQQLKANRGSR